MTTQEYIDLDYQYCAHNYHPLPVVIQEGKGAWVKDVEDKAYLDFLSAYSAVNQGHCHPKILKKLQTQAGKLTLTSRAFHNESLGKYARFLCDTLGYQKMLPMNTGVEGGETAVKICRKWAYEKKGIPENHARIIFAEGNFWGRTLGAVSASTDPKSTTHFGPFVPGFEIVPYNDLSSLEKVLKQPNIAGLMIEPIQGEAGVVVPDEGYLRQAYEICRQNNVLFIADEVQTGLGRTGKMMACDHENIKPDILILGKALSGGMMPVSAVLADNTVMDVLKPGEHGSTFGGNPLACEVAHTALEVIIEEKLPEKANDLGKQFRSRLQSIQQEHAVIQQVRGKGLLNALVIDNNNNHELAWDICLKMIKKGLLAKPTHGNIIRMAPPLVINENELEQGLNIIEETFQEVSANI